MDAVQTGAFGTIAEVRKRPWQEVFDVMERAKELQFLEYIQLKADHNG